MEYQKDTPGKREIQFPIFVSVCVLLAAGVLAGLVFTYIHTGYLFNQPSQAQISRQTDEQQIREIRREAEAVREPDASDSSASVSEDTEYNLNDKYTYIEKGDGGRVLLNKEDGSYVDLGGYAQVKAAFLYDGTGIMDDRGLAVTTDNEEWFLITTDADNPVKVDMCGYDDVRVTGYFDMTEDVPFYYDLLPDPEIDLEEGGPQS